MATNPLAMTGVEIRGPMRPGGALLEARTVRQRQLDEGVLVFENGNFERAAALIDEITTAPEFETFITLPAYRVIH